MNSNRKEAEKSKQEQVKEERITRKLIDALLQIMPAMTEADAEVILQADEKERMTPELIDTLLQFVPTMIGEEAEVILQADNNERRIREFIVAISGKDQVGEDTKIREFIVAILNNKRAEEDRKLHEFKNNISGIEQAEKERKHHEIIEAFTGKQETEHTKQEHETNFDKICIQWASRDILTGNMDEFLNNLYSNTGLFWSKKQFRTRLRDAFNRGIIKKNEKGRFGPK